MWCPLYLVVDVIDMDPLVINNYASVLILYPVKTQIDNFDKAPPPPCKKNPGN